MKYFFISLIYTTGSFISLMLCYLWRKRDSSLLSFEQNYEPIFAVAGFFLSWVFVAIFIGIFLIITIIQFFSNLIEELFDYFEYK